MMEHWEDFREALVDRMLAKLFLTQDAVTQKEFDKAIYTAATSPDLEKYKKRVWLNVEQGLGFSAPREGRRFVDQQMKPSDDYVGAVNLVDDLMYGLRDYLGNYEAMVYFYLRSLQTVAMSKYIPRPKTLSGDRKRYQRPFNKRLHLVDFIISQQLTD